MATIANWSSSHTTNGVNCNRRERADGKSLIDSACQECVEELRANPDGVAGYYGGELL